MNFQRFQLKWKTIKYFAIPQPRVGLRKLFSKWKIKPDKGLLHLWNKNFLREIYRNIQTFAFKVLRECNSWVVLEKIQSKCFFFDINQMFGRKFVKWGSFLAVLREHIFFKVEWVELRKMSEVFWAKLYYEISYFFRYFLLTLRPSARKS